MEKVEPYYQNNAKEIINTLFQGKVFKDEITRDDLSEMENLIAYLFQVNANSAKKCAEIMLKINNK